ncbi:MAG: type II secretion system F family protein [Aestuariivirga sp.]|nr:type II secretion system F family protein [Aestuariivirga sp.]
MLASGENLQQLIFLATVALASGGVVMFLLLAFFQRRKVDERVSSLIDTNARADAARPAPTKAAEISREGRRRQVQQTLKQIEARQKDRQKRLTVRLLIAQSGLTLSVARFWMISVGLGAIFAAISYLFGLPWYLSLLCGFVGTFGVPRWFLAYMRRRRQETFLTELPDAIDVIVRGLKSGLPLSDALKVIAAESAPPIGPEFWEVVEGQRVGITIDQGLERMYERMPLQEVSFMAIVLSIQSKTGGNLTETLGNLAKVLRDRRRMKNRIRAVSQEAKSSATIIGSLPLFIAGALTFLNPDYLQPLFTSSLGNLMLAFCGFWMLLGILVMRKMINFEI